MSKLEEAAKAYASCEVSEVGLAGLCGIEAGKYEPFIAGAEWQSKRSPWISVEKRLPSSDNDLYIALNTKMTPPGIDVCEFDVKSKRWTDSRHVVVYPTHWMPIPE